MPSKYSVRNFCSGFSASAKGKIAAHGDVASLRASPVMEQVFLGARE